MFNIGIFELFILGGLALIVIGPEKLPQLIKAVLKGISEFKKLSQDVKSTVKSEFEDAGVNLNELSSIKKSFPNKVNPTELDHYLKKAIDLMEQEKEELKQDIRKIESNNNQNNPEKSFLEYDTITENNHEFEKPDFIEDDPGEIKNKH